MKMAERRRLMIGTGKVALLPPEFQQVAYLNKWAGTGNSPYIDTKFIFTGNVCEFLWRGYGLDDKLGYAFGSQKSSSERFRVYMYQSRNWPYVNVGSYSSMKGWLTDKDYTAGKILGIICDEKDENSKKITIWDYATNEPWRDYYWNTVVDAAYTGTCKTGKPSYLFLSNGNTQYHSSFCYEYAAFREDGVFMREYIPCYRKDDRKPGMYDLVTREFYTNVGTGEFELGPEV